MSLHRPGSGNYENEILTHTDGNRCNRRSATFKTMGSMPQIFSCEKCQFKTDSKEKLLIHLDSKHTWLLRTNLICRSHEDLS